MVQGDLQSFTQCLLDCVLPERQQYKVARWSAEAVLLSIRRQHMYRMDCRMLQQCAQVSDW